MGAGPVVATGGVASGVGGEGGGTGLSKDRSARLGDERSYRVGEGACSFVHKLWKGGCRGERVVKKHREMHRWMFCLDGWWWKCKDAVRSRVCVECPRRSSGLRVLAWVCPACWAAALLGCDWVG